MRSTTAHFKDASGAHFFFSLSCDLAYLMIETNVNVINFCALQCVFWTIADEDGELVDHFIQVYCHIKKLVCFTNENVYKMD